MPVRPYRPPLRKNIPWAYHAGATASNLIDKAGHRVVDQASNASIDLIAKGINTAVEAGVHLIIVVGSGSLVILILVLHLLNQVQDTGDSAVQLALKLMGLPSFGLAAQASGGGGDMNDLGEKVQKGQVFNRFDGGTVAVNSGFGTRVHPVTGENKHHAGIDLALEAGYPLFTWTETEVICTTSGGYGNLATLKLGNGQVYRAGHLSACNGGNLGPGQIYGRVGTTGTSTGNHLHWEQKNNLGSLVHPQTNPLQATLTGKWPGGSGGGSVGGIDMDFIKELEGFHPTAYIDGTENGRTRWSWGYGTKAPGPGQTISQEQAHQDMRRYLEANCLPHIPDSLSAGQKTAAASLCYNVGPGVTRWDIWDEIEKGGNPNFTSYTKNTAGANLMPRRQKEQAMWDGQ